LASGEKEGGLFVRDNYRFNHFLLGVFDWLVLLFFLYCSFFLDAKEPKVHD
jgi:hypothetical protein